ncbi:hypothetical protein ACQEV4_21360 [Streptomyces shenzhenensis]|uniref:hypothetical protein n=1 Tax=Streptomyces shenzhenensis TaxID=943815 RepID=UPI003D94227E
MKEHGKGCVGILLAAVGAAFAVISWAPMARVNIDGGFEDAQRDLRVLYIDLPLIAVGGAVVPLVAWLLTLRRLRRPWVAGVVAAGALALGVWGLTNWWEPYRHPESW